MVHVILIFALAAIPLASAQETPDAAAAAPVAEAPAALPAPTPAVEVAASPAATANSPVVFQPRTNYFPALPPSRPCTAQDVQGAWRLKQAYETPPGNALMDFTAYPSQYLLFSGDSTYNAYKSQQQQNDGTAMAQLGASPQNLQQFLVQEGGFVFFYRDGVAVDTQACFIVATPRESFTAGQMLLMPPQGQSATKIVKVYDKLGSEVGASPRGTGNDRQSRRERQIQLQKQRQLERQQQRQMERQQQREEERQQQTQQRIEERTQQPKQP